MHPFEDGAIIHSEVTLERKKGQLWKKLPFCNVAKIDLQKHPLRSSFPAFLVLSLKDTICRYTDARLPANLRPGIIVY